MKKSVGAPLLGSFNSRLDVLALSPERHLEIAKSTPFSSEYNQFCTHSVEPQSVLHAFEDVLFDDGTLVRKNTW